MESRGGPKAYLESIARMDDERSSVDTVMEDMAYIKNKGARDFLIELGLVQNAVAFDTRIINILNGFGENIPDSITQSKNRCRALEEELIEKVARPCGITGSHLDRILYQNYKEITGELAGDDSTGKNCRSRKKAVCKEGKI